MDLLPDLRQGWVEFRSRPWVSVVAVTTLALGIAGSTTMFTMLSAVGSMMVPPGVDPARVGRIVWLNSASDGARGPLTGEEYAQLKAGATAFERVSASADQTMVFGGAGGPGVPVKRVSPDYFGTFDFKPSAGRVFTREDSGAGSPPVAIVREGARGRLGNPALGQVVRLGSAQYTIVGVLPDRCWFLAPNSPDLWLPLEIGADGVPAAHTVTVTARLRAGAPVDAERAQAQIQAIGERLKSQAAFAVAARRLRLVTLGEDVGKRMGFGLLGLLAPALIVLLIACGNVANLLLARAARRQQEMAVRAALGAGRLRLIRERLCESAWLAGAGGALGLALAVGGVRLLRFWIGTFEETRGAAEAVHLDARALLFASAMMVVVPLLFGLVPALAASRPGLTQALHQVPGQRRPRRGPYGGRDVLVIVEIGLAVALVVASLMFARFFAAIGRVEWGYDPSKVLAVHLSFDDDRSRRAVDARMVGDITDAVRRVPGVRAVSVGHLPGLAIAGEGQAIEFEACASRVAAIATAVGPHYFATLGLPVRRGRAILETDTAGAPPVAVISQRHADRCWPGLDPVGRRLKRGSGAEATWLTVVGVVPDAMVSVVLGDAPQPIYVPYAQAAAGRDEPRVRRADEMDAGAARAGLLLVRADNPVALIPAVRTAVRRVDPTQPLDNMGRADEPLQRLTGRVPLVVGLVAGFGFLALALGALGVFSVMSYMVAERTREFGIRIALGSSRAEVMRLVLRQAGVVVTIGTVVSFGCTLAVTRVGFREMGDMAIADPVLWASVCVLLAAVAVGAGLVPALRAMRVEPVVALRAE